MQFLAIKKSFWQDSELDNLSDSDKLCILSKSDFDSTLSFFTSSSARLIPHHLTREVISSLLKSDPVKRKNISELHVWLY